MRTLPGLLLLAATALPAQPLPRTVQLPHNDYLRFIDPDAQLAVGLDLRHVTSLIDAIANQALGDELQEKCHQGLHCA